MLFIDCNCGAFLLRRAVLWGRAVNARVRRGKQTRVICFPSITAKLRQSQTRGPFGDSYCCVLFQQSYKVCVQTRSSDSVCSLTGSDVQPEHPRRRGKKEASIATPLPSLCIGASGNTKEHLNGRYGARTGDSNQRVDNRNGVVGEVGQEAREARQNPSVPISRRRQTQDRSILRMKNHTVKM